MAKTSVLCEVSSDPPPNQPEPPTGALGLLDRLATARMVWTLSFLEALVLGAENTLTFPLSVPFMRASTGQGYLDFCAFCSGAEVAARVAVFGPTGRTLQLWLLPTIDVLIPVLSCLTGLVALQYYGRGLAAGSRRLLLVPIVAMLLDFAENAAITAVVMRYPAPSPLLATLVGLLSGLKFIAYGSLCVSVFWVLWLRRQRPRRSGTELAGPSSPEGQRTTSAL